MLKQMHCTKRCLLPRKDLTFRFGAFHGAWLRRFTGPYRPGFGVLERRGTDQTQRRWQKHLAALQQTKGVGSHSGIMSEGLLTLSPRRTFLLQFLDEVLQLQAARFLHVAQAGEELLLAEMLARPFQELG